MNKSLGALVSDVTYSRYNAKAYIATDKGHCRGRTGYLIGNSYRPRDQSESTDMFNSTSLFLDDKGNDDIFSDAGLLDAASNAAGLDYYLGPTRWLFSSDGITWKLATDSIYNTTFFNDTTAAFTALYAPSL